MRWAVWESFYSGFGSLCRRKSRWPFPTPPSIQVSVPLFAILIREFSLFVLLQQQSCCRRNPGREKVYVVSLDDWEWVCREKWEASKRGERIYYLNCSQRNKPSHNKNARPFSLSVLHSLVHSSIHLLFTWLFANRNSFSPFCTRLCTGSVFFYLGVSEGDSQRALNAHVGIILNLCAKVMANSSY